MYSERIKKLRDELFGKTERNLCAERAQILTQAYQETEGEPTIIRRAEFFDRYLREMGIYIDENPIVGALTKYRGGVAPYLEWSCYWMRKEIDELYCSLGKVVVSEEDRKALDEAIDYWKDKALIYKARQIWDQKYNGKINRDNYYKAGAWIDLICPVGRLSVDYGKVLNKGFNGIIREAEEGLSKLPLGDMEALQKRYFLESSIISCNALINFARRYAALAREMAQREQSLDRKLELEKILETCQWVPANPARSFYEALQSFWFTHLAVEIELCASGISPGRFTQYMYPFYKEDKEKGKITDEDVIELLELLFIKFTEIVIHLQSKRAYMDGMGSSFQNISLGGLDANGEDASNDLDYLVLEAQRRLRSFQPTLSIIYHDKLPEKLLMKAVEVVKTGIGMPAFFNNDVSIQRLLDHGVSLEDARNHTIIGCIEAGISHTANSMWGAFINMPKMLELALNNGKDPLTEKQLGPQTGDPRTFKSYKELHEAVKKQLEYILPLYFEFQHLGDALNAEYLPAPFTSSLIDDCIKNGKDMRQGGARYYMDGSGPVGIVNLADSLAAIKKFVFEEKAITMDELLEALKLNFEGKEELHQLLLKAPKYGNDEDYVDSIAKEWYRIFYEEHQKSTDYLGKKHRPYALSVTAHNPLGVTTGALPDGRKEGIALADATVSASPGQDRNGPTALVKSATKVIDTTKYASGQLNMKFHPLSIETKDGMKKLLEIVKTYVDLGGHHIQFNVVSSETLKDAQSYPEKYKDLIVRVAGFSALFIHLDKVVQDEIIKRTEIRF